MAVLFYHAFVAEFLVFQKALDLSSRIIIAAFCPPRVVHKVIVGELPLDLGPQVHQGDQVGVGPLLLAEGLAWILFPVSRSRCSLNLMSKKFWSKG